MISAEDKWAQEVFQNKNPSKKPCVFCSGLHDQVIGLLDYYQPCPRIKRIERDSAGNVLVLEFWPNGDWETNVVFPTQVYIPEDQPEPDN